MKTTVDIPEEALAEAQRLSGLKGKKAVIMAALDEFIRVRRLEGLLAMLGHTELDITYEDIRRGRDMNPDKRAALERWWAEQQGDPQ
jgi:Arc/MetJ family transcription regulator